jgi:hypothetical protein
VSLIEALTQAIEQKETCPSRCGGCLYLPSRQVDFLDDVLFEIKPKLSILANSMPAFLLIDNHFLHLSKFSQSEDLRLFLICSELLRYLKDSCSTTFLFKSHFRWPIDSYFVS